MILWTRAKFCSAVLRQQLRNEIQPFCSLLMTSETTGSGLRAWVVWVGRLTRGMIEEKDRKRKRKTQRKVAARCEFYISEQICSLKRKQNQRENARSCKHLCLQRHSGYAVMRRQRKTLFIQGAVWYDVWKKHVACHRATKKTRFQATQVELMAFIKHKKSNFKGN